MEISGQHRFTAEAEDVWRALLDPDALRAAIPGCELFEETGPETYRVRMRVGVPRLHGTFHGTVKVRGLAAEDDYRVFVAGEADDNPTTGDAELVVRAGERPGHSVVRYQGVLRPRGKLARAEFVLRGAAKLLAGQFFRAMERQVAVRAAR